MMTSIEEANKKPEETGSSVSGGQKKKSSSFIISAPLCAVCSKRVYITDQLKADDRVFHKTCFRCAQCNNILKLGNYASLEGKYYCKPHFKQLFALKGNYAEGFGGKKPEQLWREGKRAGEGIQLSKPDDAPQPVAPSLLPRQHEPSALASSLPSPAGGEQPVENPPQGSLVSRGAKLQSFLINQDKKREEEKKILQEMQEKRKKTQEALLGKEEDLDGLHKELNSLKEQLNEKENQLQQMQQNSQRMETEAEELRSQIITTESSKSDALRLLSELEKTTVQTGGDTGDSERFREMFAQMERIRKEKERAMEQETRSADESKHLKRQVSNLSGELDKAIESLRKEKEGATQREKKLREDLDKSKQNMRELDIAKKERARALEEAERWRKEKQAAEDQAKKMKIISSAGESTTVQDLKKANEALSAKLRDQEKQTKTASEQMRSAKSEVTKLQKDLEKARRAKEDLEKQLNGTQIGGKKPPPGFTRTAAFVLILGVVAGMSMVVGYLFGRQSS